LLFELDKYDGKLHQAAPAFPTTPYEPAANIQKMSLLYWAEHCVECAAPSCYETCDLYQPRVDYRCRRFTFGAYKNRNFASTRGYGVEISFKKWAKVEAYANLRLSPRAYVLWGEKLVETAAPAASAFGVVMEWLTKKAYWKAITHIVLEKLVRRLDRKRSDEDAPDAFLLEIYNPTEKGVRMQLSFSPLPAQSHAKNDLTRISNGFTTTLSCPSGYSRHEVDVALLGRLIESSPQFLISMVPEADSDARLVFLSSEFVKFARKKNAEGSRIKCVVFDLDNTLWKGVLVEGDDVVVSPETIALLKLLDDRGILLSIASKNDHESAWKRLQEMGLDEYFLYPQINWSPKSQSVKRIAERLNIGVDSLAFIDDSPFELDEVARAVPQILCLDARTMASLASDPRCQGSATGDGRRRRQFYREAAARETAQETYGSDYGGFLASCEISLEISSYSPEDAERIAELVQRTNQLNFSGNKHTRQALEEILSNPLLDKYVLKCSDRYGFYGTVGFCMVERAGDALCVQDFMLSCRVQGKLLEKAFFHHLLEHHNPQSARVLWVNFRQTARNQPAQRVLESLGFRQIGGRLNGFSHGMIWSSSEPLSCDFIRVGCSCTRTLPESDLLATAHKKD
jgi:FkbH-like protein